MSLEDPCDNEVLVFTQFEAYTIAFAVAEHCGYEDGEEIAAFVDRIIPEILSA